MSPSAQRRGPSSTTRWKKRCVGRRGPLLAANRSNRWARPVARCSGDRTCKAAGKPRESSASTRGRRVTGDNSRSVARAMHQLPPPRTAKGAENLRLGQRAPHCPGVNGLQEPTRRDRKGTVFGRGHSTFRTESAISCTKLAVASKGAAWPAPSISMRSRRGDGRGERADQAGDAVGAPCAVGAHDGDLDGREICRRMDSCRSSCGSPPRLPERSPWRPAATPRERRPTRFHRHGSCRRRAGASRRRRSVGRVGRAIRSWPAPRPATR